jgi:hypothetical protein
MGMWFNKQLVGWVIGFLAFLALLGVYRIFVPVDPVRVSNIWIFAGFSFGALAAALANLEMRWGVFAAGVMALIFVFSGENKDKPLIPSYCFAFGLFFVVFLRWSYKSYQNLRRFYNNRKE